MEIREYRIMAEVERTHWWYVSRRMFVGAVLRKLGISLGGRLRIADIGAGTGGMSGFLKGYGTYVGIEPSALGRALASRHGVRLSRGTAEKTGIASRSMDMVSLFDVLYHAGVDEKNALSEAWRILKPRGKLVITDSAMPWLFGPHDRAAHARQRYAVSELVRSVSDLGFTVRIQTYMFFLIFPVVVIKRLADRFTSVSDGKRTDVGRVHPLINTILIRLCRLEAVLLPHVRYPFGSSLLIVADKG